MKQFLLYLIFVISSFGLARAEHLVSGTSLAKAMADLRGDVFLGKIDNFQDLRRRTEASDVDIKFFTKKYPQTEQGFFIVSLTVEKLLTDKYDPKKIDVGIPAVKIKGTWRLLWDDRQLSARSYFQIDTITLVDETIYIVRLCNLYSEEFEKSLIEQIDLAAKSRARMR